MGRGMYDTFHHDAKRTKYVKSADRFPCSEFGTSKILHSLRSVTKNK